MNELFELLQAVASKVSPGVHVVGDRVISIRVIQAGEYGLIPVRELRAHSAIDLAKVLVEAVVAETERKIWADIERKSVKRREMAVFRAVGRSVRAEAKRQRGVIKKMRIKEPLEKGDSKTPYFRVKSPRH